MIFEEKHFQITLFVYLYFVRYWGNVYSNLISYKKTDRWYYEHYEWTNEWTDEYYELKNEY